MNIYNYTQPNEGEEVIEKLFSKDNITINRIVSNKVADGEWYDQDEDEWLVLVSGEALLVFEDEDEEIVLLKGDTFYIPRHTKHSVKKTSEDALWLTVHLK